MQEHQLYFVKGTGLLRQVAKFFSDGAIFWLWWPEDESKPRAYEPVQEKELFVALSENIVPAVYFATFIKTPVLPVLLPQYMLHHV